MDFWAEMAARGPDTVLVGGAEVRAGSRVRLRPRGRADVLDLALDGRVAVVEGVEHDDAGDVRLAVTIEDDPGRDLGDARMPGHRFFFTPAEVEPVPAGRLRVLVAGIGNVFLGDDGFGVEVVRELGRRAPRPGVDVVDFGIRGMDLLYALQRGYDAVIFIDAAPRGERPGTVSLLEPEPPAGESSMQAHGMDPVAVLRLAREICRIPERALVVACEPESVPGETSEDVVVGLSEPVRAAVPVAARLVESLLEELENDDARQDADDAGAAGPGRRGGGREAVAGDPPVHEDAADVSGRA